MRRALAGRPSVPFEVPAGVEFTSIDPETGQLATPNCPKSIQEAFVAGTAPTHACELHGPKGVLGVLSRIGRLFKWGGR
jgi:membrane carboxypeptidase/penicillin-binding protein